MSEQAIRSVVVGTAGHIDHGKSALVRALTGIDPDRLQEEKRRGITIELGFAPLDVGEGGVHIGFVDVPGHERFVKNMLAGAGGIDVMLLVVAADESVMPQTREHVEICDLLGIEAAVVAVTKADLADGDTIELVTLEAAELLDGTRFAGATIVPVSSATGAGLEGLKAALADVALRVRARDESLLPRLPVDRVFTMKGFGTVVTGTLIAGTLGSGQTVELVPKGRKSVVKGLQVHDRSVKSAAAGHRVAVNLGALGTDEVSRGDIVTLPGALSPTSLLDLRCRMLPSAPRELVHNQRVRFHIGSAEHIGRVAVLGGTCIRPGEEGFVRLRLEGRTTSLLGDRFVIRRYSPMITIGGGEVIDNLPAPRRGKREDLLARLLEIAEAKKEDRPAALLRHHAGPFGIPDLTRRFGIFGEGAAKALAALVATGDVVLLGESPIAVCGSRFLGGVEERLVAALERAHADSPLADGAPTESLRRSLPAGADEAVFRLALARLEKAGRIRTAKGLASLAEHSVELSEEQTKRLEAIAGEILEGGTAPPAAKEVLERHNERGDAKLLFDLLLSRGELVRIGSEGIYYHRRVLEGIVEELPGRAGGGAFSVPAFKDWFDISRKYAIPLLEYLDSLGLTYREGDLRRLASDRR